MVVRLRPAWTAWSMSDPDRSQGDVALIESMAEALDHLQATADRLCGGIQPRTPRSRQRGRVASRKVLRARNAAIVARARQISDVHGSRCDRRPSGRDRCIATASIRRMLTRPHVGREDAAGLMRAMSAVGGVRNESSAVRQKWRGAIAGYGAGIVNRSSNMGLLETRP